MLVPMLLVLCAIIVFPQIPLLLPKLIAPELLRMSAPILRRRRGP